MSEIARIFLPMPGSDSSSAAMLMTHPRQRDLTGTRVDLLAHELDAAVVHAGSATEPSAHSTCFVYWVAVGACRHTRERRPLAPATLNSLAASRACTTSPKPW
jgi:hypothetical protein